MQRTPAYQLLEARLGTPLKDVVLAMRADDRSWPYIARKLGQKTDHWVTGECLRKWFAEADAERTEQGSAA
jgi:hypothetical protein